jgi:hypothetical protein
MAEVTDFPESQVIRYTDRLYRLPRAQRAHLVARAAARAQGENPKMRDRVFAVIGVREKFTAP